MLNVYQIYEKVGFQTPFKIRRASWGGTVAIVTSIGGKTSGRPKGRPPYYGNPEVKADVYGPRDEKNVSLPCPGSYQWELVR